MSLDTLPAPQSNKSDDQNLDVLRDTLKSPQKSLRVRLARFIMGRSDTPADPLEPAKSLMFTSKSADPASLKAFQARALENVAWNEAHAINADVDSQKLLNELSAKIIKTQAELAELEESAPDDSSAEVNEQILAKKSELARLETAEASAKAKAAALSEEVQDTAAATLEEEQRQLEITERHNQR